ncbi:MAG TPA: hypothetical protein VGR03_01240 [Candidatus Acidoferrum sp.]|nr:hypothetical protein [Candidatus Acidoferrum sp.]
MSPKSSTSVSATIDPHCQHISPKGNRCHMLIDEHHRHSNGAKRPALCAYHANRLKAAVPVVDPEVLAADLLGDIDGFTTADEVNLFLGNLVKQLARKRIARRDAIALAYISQLLLTSQTAMAREAVAEKEAEDLYRNLVQGLSRSRSSSSGEQQSPDNAATTCPGSELAAGPGTEHARRAS